jgi:hypothetical protein
MSSKKQEEQVVQAQDNSVAQFLADDPDWGPELKGEGRPGAERFAPSVAGDPGAGSVGMASKKEKWRAKW